MSLLSVKEYKLYSNFLSTLAKDLNKFYYSKLNKTFTISNKLKGKGYDPVTTSDKAFEKFIRLKIKHITKKVLSQTCINLHLAQRSNTRIQILPRIFRKENYSARGTGSTRQIYPLS